MTLLAGRGPAAQRDRRAADTSGAVRDWLRAALPVESVLGTAIRNLNSLHLGLLRHETRDLGVEGGQVVCVDEARMLSEISSQRRELLKRARKGAEEEAQLAAQAWQKGARQLREGVHTAEQRAIWEASQQTAREDAREELRRAVMRAVLRLGRLWYDELHLSQLGNQLLAAKVISQLSREARGSMQSDLPLAMAHIQSSGGDKT